MTAVGLDDLRRLRRTLHERPELAHREHATAQLIAAFLSARGPDHLATGIGGTGVGAVFEGAEHGPTVVVRAELDALPIAELTELPYQSRTPGVAHLCGHDGHMTMVAGLADRLAENRPGRGRVCLLFQPAEETGEGAHLVVQDPFFERLAPDWAFAVHNLPGRPMGQVVVRTGTFAAGSVGAVVQLKGRTSHAAYPEEGRSPAATAAKLIHAAEQLPQELTGGGEHVSLATVIHARIGDVAFGTTPGEAVVMVTLRSDRAEGLMRLRLRLESVANELAVDHGLEVAVDWREEFPVTVNHPDAVAAVVSAAEANGLETAELDEPLRWSEDFGWFTNGRRGALVGLGSGSEQPPLHSGAYDFPDELIPIGLDLLSGAVRRALEGTEETAAAEVD
jgi:amidohydrolase